MISSRFMSSAAASRPHCAPLGAGLWEAPSTLDSSGIAQVIFCVRDGDMILLHGFIKEGRRRRISTLP